MSAKYRFTAAAMVIGACATLTLPGAGAAQQTQAIAMSPSARADALHARAEALYSTPPRYAEAAALLVRAARERDASDALAVRELITASKLYSYAKHPRQARTTMKMAARRALDMGDVARSAHAYLDAAAFAIAQKDYDDARALVTRAQRLAAAEHLAATQRAGIMERIAPAAIALQTSGH